MFKSKNKIISYYLLRIVDLDGRNIVMETLNLHWALIFTQTHIYFINDFQNIHRYTPARVSALSSIPDLLQSVNRLNCLHSFVSQSPRTHISPHTDIHIQTSPLRIRPSPAQNYTYLNTTIIKQNCWLLTIERNNDS